MPGKLRAARFALRKLRIPRPVRIPDRFGNVLWCPSLDEPIAVGLFAHGVYEPDTLGAILSRLNVRGIFVDVGANVGAIALPVAARRPDAQVVCIEADPSIAAILRRNVVENTRLNIKVVECLAGPVDDPAVSFYCAPDHKFGMGSVGPQFHAAPLTLRQRALDDVLDELGLDSVDIVKLDVEGAERGVLQGLVRRLTGPRPPAVVFEFADWAEARIPVQAPGDAQEFIMSLGYRVFVLAPGGAAGPVLDRPITGGTAMVLALPFVS